jgi:hypothetical protein
MRLSSVHVSEVGDPRGVLQRDVQFLLHEFAHNDGRRRRDGETMGGMRGDAVVLCRDLRRACVRIQAAAADGGQVLIDLADISARVFP